MSDAVLVPRELPINDPTNPAHRLADDLRRGRIPGYAADDVRAVLTTLAASPSVGGWEDISTWKPQDAAAHWPYLEALIVVDGIVMAGDWKPGGNPPASGEWWSASLDSEDGDRVHPTHWTPLPPPPSVSTGSRPQEAILPQTEKGS